MMVSKNHPVSEWTNEVMVSKNMANKKQMTSIKLPVNPRSFHFIGPVLHRSSDFFWPPGHSIIDDCFLDHGVTASKNKLLVLGNS